MIGGIIKGMNIKFLGGNIMNSTRNSKVISKNQVGNYTRTVYLDGTSNETFYHSSNGATVSYDYSNGKKVSRTITDKYGNKVTTKY